MLLWILATAASSILVDSIAHAYVAHWLVVVILAGTCGMLSCLRVVPWRYWIRRLIVVERGLNRIVQEKTSRCGMAWFALSRCILLLLLSLLSNFIRSPLIGRILQELLIRVVLIGTLRSLLSLWVVCGILNHNFILLQEGVHPGCARSWVLRSLHLMLTRYIFILSCTTQRTLMWRLGFRLFLVGHNF